MALIEWFTEGAKETGAEVEVIRAASLKYKSFGCLSCRSCQKNKAYECAIKDDATPVLKRMAHVDVIVMATPLYFFGASAQLKAMVDRMFSLYKWDNSAGTMKTPLKGKTLVFMLSAFEGDGLDMAEMPFRMTAEYTGMTYRSLLVPHAGVSGDIRKKKDVREKAINLGKIAGK